MISLRRNAWLRQVNPAPPDWQRAFGRVAPIEVDLGCGRGTYARQRAFNFPEINLVALDARQKWIARLREWCREQGLNNLRAIRCDVTQDLPLLFAEGSVAAFTVHHPDPWWKKKHQKRRLIQPEIVELLARLLAPGGLVYLQTDVPDLALEIASAFDACPRFGSVAAETVRLERLGGLRSHREKKCLELGIPVLRLAYVILEERPHPP